MLSGRARTAVIAVAVLWASGATGQEPVRVSQEGVYLDFQDADIRVVITALAEVGALNVIYSDLPERTVTLRTAQPVSPEDVLGLLGSIARANGLIMIEEAGLIRIRAAETGEVLEEGQPGAAAQLRIFVYRLKHARAPRVAATLQLLFGGAPGRVGAPQRPATLTDRLRDMQIPPLEEQGQPQVDVQMGPVVPAGLPAALSANIQIVPDELTNSLLIRASPADWEVAQQAIEALDLRPLQVLVEVLIAEVSRDKNLDVGTNATVVTGDKDALVTGTLIGRTIGDFVLNVVTLGSTSVDAALNLLASSANVQIVSRPVIFAQNNQEASILVGSQRPFVQVARFLPTDNAARDQVVQYRDVGTKLTILPTINSEGYVNMSVVQEISTATAEIQFGAPVINTRQASTQLFLRDGQTAVIGGLIETITEKSSTGIPILKDVPLLGLLFGSTRDKTSKSELFVFLTVHVVETDEDMDRIREGVGEGTELFGEELRSQRPIIPPQDSIARPRMDDSDG